MYYTTTSHVPLAISDSELGMGDRARMEAVGIVALASMRGGDSRDNQLMYASRLISHQVQEVMTSTSLICCCQSLSACRDMEVRTPVGFTVGM